MMTTSKLMLDDKVKEILSGYLPSKQVSLCDNKELCYFGNMPTLCDIDNKYGKKIPLIWLVGQITDLVAFTNCKNIVNETQIRELARMINNEYGYYKLSELMLFFYQFKNGQYGDFYGSISPISIMKSLLKFKAERAMEYEQYHNRMNEIKRQKDKEGCITYEEWRKNYSSKQQN